MGDSRGSIGMGGLDKRASILGLGTLSHGYPCGVHLEYTIPLDQRYSLVAWTHPGRRLEARRRAFRDTPRSWQTSGDSVCINSLDPLCPLIGCWLTINGSIPSSGGAVTLLRKRIRPRYACLDQRGQTSKADRLDGPRIRADACSTCREINDTETLSNTTLSIENPKTRVVQAPTIAILETVEYRVMAFGPPQISFPLPLHGMLHCEEKVLRAPPFTRELPQQHSDAYSRPAKV